ncbi:MAG: hypothetical protein HYZ08_02945 [Candidatus Kerfeldbacteria bacterium]|nr:hypothetical protein [Candidatus Kerfeldbacteria bacterium]
MRIYFWTPQPIEEKIRWNALRKAFHARGIMVISNHDRHIRASIDALRKTPSDTSHFLSLFHGLVVDISSPHEDVGFLIAHATFARLPVLALIGRNRSLRDLLDYVRSDVRRALIQEFDDRKTPVEDTVQQFIQRMQHPLKKESAPSIKFTLRISPELSEYLEWKGRNVRIKKAEFLRHFLSQMMRDDAEYRNYRRSLK